MRDVLGDLNPGQRHAAEAVRGPVCILAGAGSGKTTTITRRIANQVRTGAFEARQILAVTFTDKAAGELAARLERLDAPGVTARTFHATALRQLSALSARPIGVIPSKYALLRDVCRGLPRELHDRPLGDIATEIERAKNARVDPARYLDWLAGSQSPLPAELMQRVYDGYERAKERLGKFDFEDLLERLIQVYETDRQALERFKRGCRSITVDEYQDVNLLQQTLLERWLDGRDELCAVGDDYQSIYGFTGASPRWLLGMRERYPHAAVFTLEENYRSTPEVLALANRLVPMLAGAAKELRPTRAAGPKPLIRSFDGVQAETGFLTDEIQRLNASGIRYDEIAVLYRVNYRSVDYEQALFEAGTPFLVQDGGFLTRPAARGMLRQIGRSEETAVADRVLALAREAHWDPDPDEGLPPQELTRQADLSRLVQLAAEYNDGERTLAEFAASLEERFGSKREREAVRLMTYHSAKGLEFEAVFLPKLEQRELPYRRALERGEISEERRLFYVGMTRAKTHLYLTCDRNRARSQFLAELDGAELRAKAHQSILRDTKSRRRAKAKTSGKPWTKSRSPSEPSLKPHLSEDSWKPFSRSPMHKPPSTTRDTD